MNTQEDTPGFSCTGSILMCDHESKVSPGAGGLQRLRLVWVWQARWVEDSWSAAGGRRAFPGNARHGVNPRGAPVDYWHGTAASLILSTPSWPLQVEINPPKVLMAVVLPQAPEWGRSELWDTNLAKTLEQLLGNEGLYIIPNSVCPTGNSQPPSLDGGEFS